MDAVRYALAGAGVSAVVGASAWSGAIALHAMQPMGCIGDECQVRSMRQATATTSWLVVLALVAILAFVAALVIALWRGSNLGRPGLTGLGACLVGMVGLTIAAASPLRDQVRPAPFLLLILVGLALIAWTVWRSELVPTWAAVGLLIGFLAFAGYTEQTNRVFFAAPFGVAWLAAGVALIYRSRAVTSRLDETTT